MIPDKIWVTPSELTSILAEKRHDYYEAYIRKDYLLEWAKNEKSKCSDETHPYVQFMNVVIDKINSL